jgi:alanine racemase
VGDRAYAEARPIWAEIDLAAISRNIALIRTRVGRPVRIIAPVKANAYGHGVVAVGRHLETLGVDGLATANLDDAVALRQGGVQLRILLYGSQLPGGLPVLLEHGLTPTVYARESVQALAALAKTTGRIVDVHLKVDGGLGRLGVRPDDAPALVRELLGHPQLRLEGMYTHIPFGDRADAGWAGRRLAAFARLVGEIEAEHGIRVDFAQAAASSVIAGALPDALNTIAPGHLAFGLSPIAGERAEAMGFQKALRALRARLIHVGRHDIGDDVIGAGPGGVTVAGPFGVILFGMDNGYRPPPRPAYMLVGGRRCPVRSVSAEYTVIDLTEVPDAAVGDSVTIIGEDGDQVLSAEDVAEQVGAPSAAYWLVGLRNVPRSYPSAP